jgi:hypothetical protein
MGYVWYYIICRLGCGWICALLVANCLKPSVISYSFFVVLINVLFCWLYILPSVLISISELICSSQRWRVSLTKIIFVAGWQAAELDVMNQVIRTSSVPNILRIMKKMAKGHPVLWHGSKLQLPKLWCSNTNYDNSLAYKWTNGQICNIAYVHQS